MAHWLNKLGDAHYPLDHDNRLANLLLWPDGGVTRMWDGDAVPKLDEAQVISLGVRPSQHLAILCAIVDNGGANIRVQLLRYSVSMLPFSHYFPDRNGEALAIQYTSPDRTRGSEPIEAVERETSTEEGADLEEMAEVSQETKEALPSAHRDANIRDLLPRGSRVLRYALLAANQTVRVNWTQGRKARSFDMPPTGRTKKLCDLGLAELETAGFNVSPMVRLPTSSAE